MNCDVIQHHIRMLFSLAQRIFIADEYLAVDDCIMTKRPLTHTCECRVMRACSRYYHLIVYATVHSRQANTQQRSAATVRGRLVLNFRASKYVTHTHERLVAPEHSRGNYN